MTAPGIEVARSTPQQTQDTNRGIAEPGGRAQPSRQATLPAGRTRRRRSTTGKAPMTFAPSGIPRRGIMIAKERRKHRGERDSGPGDDQTCCG